MSYEKEIAELWKDWKSSTDKYEEATEDGYDVDADMWAHDVMEIERQIHVYEQATKADECEAKAKAFDLICEVMDYHYPTVNDRKYLNGYQHPKASLKDIDAIINSYESGEPNAKK